MAGACQNDDVLSNQKTQRRESENYLSIEMTKSQKVLYWPIKPKHAALRSRYCQSWIKYVDENGW